MILASYAVTALAFLAIGFAIGRRRRDAKMRHEIARFGLMVIEAMSANNANKG